MKWKINYSEKSLADLDQIYEYICNELFMLETAVKQAEKIMEKIDFLETMPESNLNIKVDSSSIYEYNARL